MDSQRVVTVEINGQRYPIRSHLDAGYIAELAAFVDQKIRLAQRECPAGDSLKTAILAALNIADECFRVRDEDAERRRDLGTRAEALERMLDLALGLSPDPQAVPDTGTAPLARTAGSF
jgi:cell division protein ZapA (FtsZ GTPase activity inhibitor)